MFELDQDALIAAASTLTKMPTETGSAFSAMPDTVPDAPTMSVPTDAGGAGAGGEGGGDETIEQMIHRISKREGVDPKLIAAMAAKESRGKKSARSWAGNKGVLQISDDKVPTYYKENPKASPYDPEANITSGVRYMKHLLKTYNGDVRRALAAYNAGEKSALKRADWEKYAINWSNDAEVQAGRKPRGAADKTNTLNYVNNIYKNYRGGEAFTSVGYQIDDDAVKAAANVLKGGTPSFTPQTLDADALNAAAGKLSSTQPTQPTTPPEPVGIQNPQEMGFSDPNTKQEYFDTGDRTGLKDNQWRVQAFPNVRKSPTDKAVDTTPFVIERDLDGNYYKMKSGDVVQRKRQNPTTVTKVPTKVPVTRQPTTGGTTQPQSPLEQLESKGEVNLGSAKVKLVGKPDENTLKVEDENGETYDINKQTGEVRDDSLAEVADKFTYSKVPWDQKPYTPLDTAKNIIREQLASQINEKYGIPKQDFIAFSQGRGLVNYYTKGEATDRDIYTERYDNGKLGASTITATPDNVSSTYTITRRDFADLRAYSAKQSKLREDAILQMISQGQTPSPELYAKLEVDPNKLQTDRRDDFLMAQEANKVSLQDFERFKSQVKATNPKLDDYQIYMEATRKMGWYKDGYVDQELDAYNRRKQQVTLDQTMHYNQMGEYAAGSQSQQVEVGGGSNPYAAATIKKWTDEQLAQEQQKYGFFAVLNRLNDKVMRETEQATQNLKNRMAALWGDGYIPTWAYTKEAFKNSAYSFGRGLFTTIVGDTIQGSVILTKPIADLASSIFGSGSIKNLKVTDHPLYKAVDTVEKFIDGEYGGQGDYTHDFSLKPDSYDDFSQSGDWNSLVGVTSFMSTDVPQAAASSIGFIIPSLSRTPRLAIALYSTVGMTANGYNEAKQAGASELDAQRYAIVSGGLLGWTEVLGASNALIRLNKGAAGSTWRRLLMTALEENIKEIPEEMLQEGLQQFGSNVIASLTYDPNRAYDKEVARSMAAAGLSTPIISTGVTILNAVRRARFIKAVLEYDKTEGMEGLRDFGAGDIFLYGKRIKVDEQMQSLVDRHFELKQKIAEGYKRIAALTKDAMSKPLDKRAVNVAAVNGIAKQMSVYIAEQQGLAETIQKNSGITKPAPTEFVSDSKVEEAKKEEAATPYKEGQFVPNAEEIEKTGAPEPIYKGALPEGATPVTPTVPVTPEPTVTPAPTEPVTPDVPTDTVVTQPDAAVTEEEPAWKSTGIDLTDAIKRGSVRADGKISMYGNDMVADEHNSAAVIQSTATSRDILQEALDKLRAAPEGSDVAEVVGKDLAPTGKYSFGTNIQEAIRYYTKQVESANQYMADIRLAHEAYKASQKTSSVDTGGAISAPDTGVTTPETKPEWIDSEYPFRDFLATKGLDPKTFKPSHPDYDKVLGEFTTTRAKWDSRFAEPTDTTTTTPTVQPTEQPTGKVAPETVTTDRTNKTKKELGLTWIKDRDHIDTALNNGFTEIRDSKGMSLVNPETGESIPVMKAMREEVKRSVDSRKQSQTVDSNTETVTAPETKATVDTATNPAVTDITEPAPKPKPTVTNRGYNFNGITNTETHPNSMEYEMNGRTGLEEWAGENPQAVKDINKEHPISDVDKKLLKIIENDGTIEEEDWQGSPKSLLTALQKHGLLEHLSMTEISSDLKEDLADMDSEERRQAKLDYIGEQLGYENTDEFLNKFDARHDALQQRYKEAYDQTHRNQTTDKAPFKAGDEVVYHKDGNQSTGYFVRDNNNGTSDIERINGEVQTVPTSSLSMPETAEEADTDEAAPKQIYDAGDEVILKDGRKATVEWIEPDGRLTVSTDDYDGTFKVPVSSVKGFAQEEKPAYRPENEVHDPAALENRLDNLVKEDYISITGHETIFRLINQGELAKANDLLTHIEKEIEKTAYSTTEEGGKRIKGVIKANVEALLRLIGEQMYKGDLVDITVKETFQNSFDAVKAAKEKGLITDPQIKMIFDEGNRTLTIMDNGIGMNQKIILDAFLTIAGTSKEASNSSGGFGMAKAAFLFGNERVDVETVRDGTKYTFFVTPEYVSGAKKIDIKAEKTDEPSGTKLTIKVPESVTSANGDKRDIYFPYDPSKLGALEKPIIGDVEVLVWNKKYYHLDNDPQWEPVKGIGKHFDYEAMPLYTKIHFSWGTADLYISKDKVNKYDVDHFVLSNGIFQFENKFGKWDSPFLRHVYVDIHPSVKAGDMLYPFNIQREGFSHVVANDVAALSGYLTTLGAIENAEEWSETFKSMKSLPRVRVSDAELTEEQKRAIGDQIVKDLAPVEKQDDAYDSISIEDDTVTAVDKRGEKVVLFTGKTADESFEADKKLKGVADLLIDVGLSTDEPIYHNNVNVDWITVHPDAGALFTELGSLMNDLKDELKKIDTYATYGLRYNDWYVGISIDKQYAGVNINVPYNGAFINPFYILDGVKNMHELVECIYHTMVHEFTHVYARNHNQQFTSTIWGLQTYLAGTGANTKMRVRLESVLNKYRDAYNAMRAEYDKITTKNLKGSIEGVESTDEYAGADKESLDRKAEEFWGELWPRYSKTETSNVVESGNSGEGRGDGERVSTDAGHNEQVQDGQGTGKLSELRVGDVLKFANGNTGIVVSIEDGNVTAALPDGSYRQVPSILSKPVDTPNPQSLSVVTGSAPVQPTTAEDSKFESLEDEEVHNMLITNIQLPLSQTNNGVDKPVSSTHVIDGFRKVLETLGNTVIRFGRTGSIRAQGVYKPRVDVIRLSRANNIVAAAHEVGHAIHKAVLGEISGASFNGVDPLVKTQLVELGRALYGTRTPVGGYKSEGFAEFVRLWLTGETATTPTDAIEDWFNREVLANNPEFEEAMHAAGEILERYQEQGASMRAEANMQKATPWANRWKSIKDFFKRIPTEFIDELTPLLNVVRNVEAITGTPLAAGSNPFLVASAFRGLAAQHADYMVYSHMIDAAGNIVGKPLIDATSLVRGREEDFLKYLWARRTVELNQQGKSSGMSIDDANFLINELGNPQFDMAAQRVYDWNNGVLDYVRQMCPDLSDAVDRIMLDSQFYVPLMRVFDEEGGEALAGKYNGFAGNALKRLKGSDRRVKDFFPQIIANAERLLQMAHKRKVIDTVMALNNLDGVGGIIEEVPRNMVPTSITLSQIATGLEHAGVDLDTIDLNEVATFFTPAATPHGKDPIVPVYRDGSTRWYRVPADLYNALSGLDVYRLGKYWNMFAGAPTRAFRLGTTGLRASFSLFTNPVRDVTTLLMQTKTSNPAALMLDYMRSMLGAINPARLAGHEHPEMDLLQRLGVNMSQPLGMDEKAASSAAKRLFQSRLRRVAGSPINFIRELLSVPEMIPREAEVRAVAKQIGYNIGDKINFDQFVQLSMAGRRVTVDFAAMGKTGKVLNQLVPFFNANIQGSRSFVRAIKENPIKTILTGLATFTIPTLLNWWRYKDEDWWQMMPDLERFNYWHIRNGDDILQIPRTQDWGGVFAGIPEAIADAWYRRNPEGFYKSFGYLLDNVTPDVLPSYARAMIEQWRNEVDYFDKPIVPKSEENLPPEEQYSPYTSEVAKWLGRNLPALEFMGVPINSPRRIDQFVRSMFGGLGGDLMKVFDYSKKEGLGSKSDIPVIGRLFRQGGVQGTGSVAVDKFYDKLNAAKTRGASVLNPETDVEKQDRELLEEAGKTIAVVRKLAVGAETVDERNRYSRLIDAIADQSVNGQIDYNRERYRLLKPEDIDLLNGMKAKMEEVNRMKDVIKTGSGDALKELPKSEQREILNDALLSETQKTFSKMTGRDQLFKFRVSTLEAKAETVPFLEKSIKTLESKKEREPQEDSLLKELKRAVANYDTEMDAEDESRQESLSAVEEKAKAVIFPEGSRRRRPVRSGKTNRNPRSTDTLKKLRELYGQ